MGLVREGDIRLVFVNCLTSMLSSIYDAFLLIFGRGLLLYKSYFVSTTSFNILPQLLLQLALLARQLVVFYLRFVKLISDRVSFRIHEYLTDRRNDLWFSP